MIESSSFYATLNIDEHSQLLTVAPLPAITLYQRKGAVMKLRCGLELESCPFSFVTHELNRALNMIKALGQAVHQASANYPVA